jgi:hypothetical protein
VLLLLLLRVPPQQLVLVRGLQGQLPAALRVWLVPPPLLRAPLLPPAPELRVPPSALLQPPLACQQLLLAPA